MNPLGPVLLVAGDGSASPAVWSSLGPQRDEETAVADRERGVRDELSHAPADFYWERAGALPVEVAAEQSELFG